MCPGRRHGRGKDPADLRPRLQQAGLPLGAADHARADRLGSGHVPHPQGGRWLPDQGGQGWSEVRVQRSDQIKMGQIRSGILYAAIRARLNSLLREGLY